MNVLPKVLVTDAQMRNSLAIIRSLGKSGLDVTASEETRFATGMFSKYCHGKVVYPSPKDQSKYVEFMLDHVKKNRYQAIFPVTDAAVVPIVKHKDDFSKFTIVPYPDYDIFTGALDKAKTLKIALDNNVPCPRTYFIESWAELEDLRDKLQYPVLIKPRTGFGSRGIALCKTYEELVIRYDEHFKIFGPLLLQEYIPYGGEVGVYALCNFNSEPRAVCVQRRIRSYPISGGPSTHRESVENPELIKTAFRLLKALKWTGVAMVEFRVDARDNVPKLMEVNPRFWGSLQLSILSGVDFPWLLYKMYTDGDVEPTMDYKKGVRCRWILPGDILWYVSSPNKLKNLPGFLEITNDDILSFTDPGPTLGFTLAAMRYMFDGKMWKLILRKPIEGR